MNELLLVAPACREPGKEKRLNGVLEYCLNGVGTQTVRFAADFEAVKNRRILFVVNIGQSGVNLEYYALLKKLRQDSRFLEGCVAGIIVDGNLELYTKGVARELAFCANQAGCLFVGRPLVEATGSMKNFHVLASNMETNLLDAYKKSAKELVERILSFEPPKISRPNILALHAGNIKTSNTYRLYKMVEEGLAGFDINELTLRNGTIMDCIGCPYKTCLHLGENGLCFYGGPIVESVFPAVEACDALMLLCANYNDAVGANLAAFINRLTALYRKARFYHKAVYAIVVSGYSGGDLVAQQVLGALNMNKAFVLPPRFALLQTANEPGSIEKVEGIEEQARAFAKSLDSYFFPG